MKANKDFVLLTLATNDEKVIVAKDNIAFAMSSDGMRDDGTKGDRYTRIFLKNLLIDDETKWVDVKETPVQIANG